MNDDKTKKIPDEANVVFKGVLHDVYQWQQETFDGSFQTYEVIKRRNTVTMLAVTTDKKIIVNYEEQPHRGKFIAIPGGICEDRETDLENAKRELEEESGFRTDSWELIMKYDVLKNRKIDWWDCFYIARGCEKTGTVKFDPGEKIETALLSFEEFMKIIWDESFRNKQLRDFIKERGGEVEFKKFLFEE